MVKLKSWLKKKSLHNWTMLLLIYLLLVSVLACVMLTSQLVRDIKQLETTITQYQTNETTYQNAINQALKIIQILKDK